MRLTRSLATGLASLALLPALGQAQSGRLFDNSWFWGVSAGDMTFWTNAVAHQQAPTFGIEWLITQKHTALYIGLDESIFHQNNVAYTNVGRQYSDSTLTTYNDIAYGASTPIRNSRQLDLAFMAFPGHGAIRPYAGLGAAFIWVQGLKEDQNPPTSTGLGPAAYWYPTYYGSQYRDDLSAWVSPVLILGVQAQINRFAVFAQGQVMATNNNHIFADQAIYVLQGGVRFRVSSSFTPDW
jgi:hypothetical protein